MRLQHAQALPPPPSSPQRRGSRVWIAGRGKGSGSPPSRGRRKDWRSALTITECELNPVLVRASCKCLTSAGIRIRKLMNLLAESATRNTKLMVCKGPSTTNHFGPTVFPVGQVCGVGEKGLALWLSNCLFPGQQSLSRALSCSGLVARAAMRSIT